MMYLDYLSQQHYMAEMVRYPFIFLQVNIFEKLRAGKLSHAKKLISGQLDMIPFVHSGTSAFLILNS